MGGAARAQLIGGPGWRHDATGWKSMGRERRPANDIPGEGEAVAIC